MHVSMNAVSEPASCKSITWYLSEALVGEMFVLRKCLHDVFDLLRLSVVQFDRSVK